MCPRTARFASPGLSCLIWNTGLQTSARLHGGVGAEGVGGPDAFGASAVNVTADPFPKEKALHDIAANGVSVPRPHSGRTSVLHGQDRTSLVSAFEVAA